MLIQLYDDYVEACMAREAMSVDYPDCGISYHYPTGRFDGDVYYVLQLTNDHDYLIKPLDQFLSIEGKAINRHFINWVDSVTAFKAIKKAVAHA